METLALLTDGPVRIATAAERANAGALRTPPREGEWSPAQILAHLRACADVWGSCIATILAEDRPTIRAVSPRTWILSTDYPELQFQASLRAYAAQRADLVATLKPLPPEAWSRQAVVTGAGPVLERTLNWYAQGMATHERSHVKQIERLTKLADRQSR